MHLTFVLVYGMFLLLAKFSNVYSIRKADSYKLSLSYFVNKMLTFSHRVDNT